MATPSTLEDGTPPSLEAAVRQYSDWGWLTVHVGTRVLLTTDWSISAVEMPSSIAARMTTYLRIRMLAGPAFELPGHPLRALMLTTSADDASTVDLVRLRARGVTTHRRGVLVPLPPSHLENGPVRWLGAPPADRPVLAPFSAVVAAARAVVDLGRETR